MTELAERDLNLPQSNETAPLKGDDLNSLLEMLGNGWHAFEEHHLEKDYEFKNFQEALNFTNKVGELAESVDHHPEICLTWGKVMISIWTHTIGGLSEADFVFAARTDRLLDKA
jgi:4a-hydroxytetrahydrobiopterin dehydratase